MLITESVLTNIEKSFMYASSGDLMEAARHLRQIRGKGVTDEDYLERLCSCLMLNDFSQVGEDFIKGSFLFQNGFLLLIGPYLRTRNGKKEVRLTGIFGISLTVNEHHKDLIACAGELFDIPMTTVLKIIDYRRISSFGLTGHDGGEAFLVPNGWGFKEATEGYALNDITEQYFRFKSGAFYLNKILESETANNLLIPLVSPISGINYRRKEFHYHEASHKTGFGFSKKLSEGLFKGAHFCGVEEWRADGVSFALMEKHLSRLEYSDMVSATIALRLTVDLFRFKGPMNDPDVIATALMITNMLNSGSLDMTSDNKLRLKCEAGATFDLISTQKKLAVELTKNEIKLGAEEIKSLYQEIRPSGDAVNILSSISKTLPSYF